MFDSSRVFFIMRHVNIYMTYTLVCKIQV